VLDGLEVGFEYAPGNAAAFAAGVNALVRDPARLHRCRPEAFRLARTRFNWEAEQRRLVDLVERLHEPSEHAERRVRLSAVPASPAEAGHQGELKVPAR